MGYDYCQECLDQMTAEQSQTTPTPGPLVRAPSPEGPPAPSVTVCAQCRKTVPSGQYCSECGLVFAKAPAPAAHKRARPTHTGPPSDEDLFNPLFCRECHQRTPRSSLDDRGVCGRCVEARAQKVRDAQTREYEARLQWAVAVVKVSGPKSDAGLLGLQDSVELAEALLFLGRTTESQEMVATIQLREARSTGLGICPACGWANIAHVGSERPQTSSVAFGDPIFVAAVMLGTLASNAGRATVHTLRCNDCGHTYQAEGSLNK